MSFYVVSHKVADFGKWKKVYDAFESTRVKYQVKESMVLQAADDPNHVLVVGEGKLEAIQKFVASDDLKAGMKKAGIEGEPHVFIGNRAE